MNEIVGRVPNKSKNIKAKKISSPFWPGIDIEKAEKAFNGTYIGDFAIKDKNGNWTEIPVAVFFNPKPDLDKGHKHLFGLFMRGHSLIICDASIVGEVEWSGALAQNGEILISTYRHDYKKSSDGTAIIDGGQDYIRSNGCELVKIKLDIQSLIQRRLGSQPTLNAPLKRLESGYAG